MSKPSASGRRRNTVWVEGQGWMYVPDGKYHRHLIGGGSVLKAVTRARRAAAGRPMGHATGALRAQRAAFGRLMTVANQLESDTTTKEAA